MAGNPPKYGPVAVSACVNNASLLVRRARLGTAGLGLEFRTVSKEIAVLLGRRYARFARPGVERFVFETVKSDAKGGSYLPEIRRNGRRLELRRGDFTASLDLSSCFGRLEVFPSEQSLDAFIRSLLSSLLAFRGGLMLHSAGILKNGRAYLFLGKSGAGKSTLSRLAYGRTRGVEVISDEINMVRPVNSGFMVYGSPFWGEMRSDGRPGRWPLGGLYLLKKARRNALRRCLPGEAARMLLRCSLNFDRSPEAAAEIMAGASALLREIPCARFEFAKKDGACLRLIGT